MECSATNEKSDSNMQKEREKVLMNETDKDNNPNIINISENNTKCEKENNKIDLPLANTKKELLKNLNSSNDENKSLLLKIKSKHILKKIKEFFNQQILYKLVVHSKILQQKLNINLVYYQLIYYSKIQMIPMHYFYYHPRCRENQEKGLKEDVIKNNIKKSNYEKFIINFSNIYLNDLRKYYKEGSGQFLEINSPFINILSKAENFDLFLLDIKINNDNNLDTKYINLFSNLNQNNLAYPQIKLTIESKDIINKLKLYNINFGAIKGLSIYNNISYDIYQNIFSYVNGFNNISLLDLSNSSSSKINCSLEIINNFKSLKYLTLNDFKFENPFFLVVIILDLQKEIILIII